MPRAVAQQTSLSVHLVKAQQTASTCLRNISQLDKHAILHEGKAIGELYLAKPKTNSPRWQKFLAPFGPSLRSIQNRTNSAVLLVPAKGRLFAVAFGYGRGLLAQDSTEDGFGLRVALNAIPDEQLRVVDKKSLDAFALHTQTQAIRSGRLRQFGVDLEQDLVQAVTGEPDDSTLGSRLVGKDALGIVTTATVPELPALFERLLSEFKSQKYKVRYPEIERMAEERDPAKVAALDAELAQKFNKSDFARLWLAVPESISWSTTSGFRYTNSDDEIYPDLHINELLEHVRDPSNIANLKQRRAFAVDASTDASFVSWSIYKCIHSEIDLGADTYVLSSGKWFRLERNFLNQVNTYVAGLLTPHNFPPSTAREAEGAYNIRAQAQRTDLAHMDTRLIRIGGGRSSVEFCDLFSTSRQMIHVKRFAGSGVLSHLFAQGATSAEALLLNETFRRDVQSALPSTFQNLISPESLDPRQFEIQYAIIGRPMGTKSLAEVLPFFSRATLKRNAQRLTNAGYKVSVAWIPNA